MKPIASVAKRELKWSQPSAHKMEYELHAGEELVATLRFRSMFGSFAIAEAGGGCWTFKRAGFVRTRVNIRSCDDDARDIAVFKNSTWSGGGSLEIPGGRVFQASTNFWNTKFSINTQTDEPLVEFKTGGVVHLSAKVSIRPQAVSMPELPLFVTLGWYLAVMMNCDSSGAAAAAG